MAEDSGWKKPTSDEAVKAKTGRTWGEWIEALDGAGAQGKSHKEIVAILADGFDVGPWWRQMVTVGYEQAKGMRGRHQTATGWTAGGSKTVAVPVERLYQAWEDGQLRRRWLGDVPFDLRKAMPNKAMRVTWSDGSDLSVLFEARGEVKSRVTVDQRKLPDADAVQRAKAFWRERLGKLQSLLEG